MLPFADFGLSLQRTELSDTVPSDGEFGTLESRQPLCHHVLFNVRVILFDLISVSD